MTRWDRVVFLGSFLLIFSLSLFVTTRSVLAVACAGACGGSFTCDAGLTCDAGSATCGIKYATCVGSSCIAANAWDVSAPCNTPNSCAPGTTRTSIWTYSACTATCGLNSRIGTCTAQAQNNCTAPACTAPAGAVGSTYTDNVTCACVGQNPQTPAITSIGPSCSTTGQVTAAWTFGAGGCGGAWGYACSTPSNTFYIKDGGVTIVSGIPAGTSPYSKVLTLSGGLHQISVCASNGATSTCSTASPITVSVDTNPPPIPVGSVSYVPDGTCADKFFPKYTWSSVSDVGCGGLNATPYWSQGSTDAAFGSVFAGWTNTWVNSLTLQAGTSDVPDKSLSFRVRSRDSFNQQSAWSATNTVVVPTPSPYPTINISGSFTEDVGATSGTTCVSNMSINPLDLVLQPSISPSNGVTSSCTKTATTYSCNITVNNQQGLCVSPNINISMSGTYPGYSSLGWRSSGICSFPPVSYNMGIGTTQSAPIFFQYSGSGGSGNGGGSGGWFKVKDTTFNSRLSGRQNFIPNSIQPFDASGDDSIANKNMMIGTAGLLIQSDPLDVGSGTTYSQNNWYTNAYTYTNDVSYSKYLDYVKSRKDYQTITNLNQITSDGIYSISSSVALTSSQFDGKKVVLVIGNGGSATFNADFTTTGSVAVLAKDIIIDPAVAQVNAILVGENVTVGSSSTGLKIKGNLIDQSTLLQDRTQTDARKPSLFVIFDSQMYLNLLPYLSTSTYDWKQIQ